MMDVSLYAQLEYCDEQMARLAKWQSLHPSERERQEALIRAMQQTIRAELDRRMNDRSKANG